VNSPATEDFTKVSHDVFRATNHTVNKNKKRKFFLIHNQKRNFKIVLEEKMKRNHTTV